MLNEQLVNNIIIKQTNKKHNAKHSPNILKVTLYCISSTLNTDTHG